MRIALAGTALLLGYMSVTRSLGYTLRGGDIERAYQLAPADGRITAILSGARLSADQGASGRAEAKRLARSALKTEPMAVEAVNTLGFDASFAGQLTNARRLFNYANRLSRRNLQTQLWAIENAVAQGDVAGALNHYDIALRTAGSAPDLLFPVMAGAIENPDVRQALIRTLRARPPWTTAFLNYAAASSVAPTATADLLRKLHSAGVPVPDAARTIMVNTLIAANRPDDAWNYYANIRPGADRRRSRDPRFQTDLANPSPFDWVALNDEGIVTTIRSDSAGGFFEFALATGAGGPMLRQMQILPPGKYMLTGAWADINQPSESRPYWLLACTNGREVGRIDMSNSGQSGGHFSGSFVISAGCDTQYLSLVGRPSDAVGGVSGRILAVALRPVG